MYRSSLLASCVALNNDGVDKFVKGQNLEEACRKFRQALYIVKKQGSKWIQGDQAYAVVEARHQRMVAKSLTKVQRPPKAQHFEENRDVSSYLQHHPQQEQRKPSPPSVQGMQGIVNMGQSLRKSWDSITSTKPVRLGNYPTSDEPDSLRWSLATTVISFNLALTYQIIGFMDSSPQEAKKRWEAALALYELACSLRLVVVSRKSFKGDVLAALDTLIVQNTIKLHTQLNTIPSQYSNFRKLARYVRLVESSLKKAERQQLTG